LAQLDVVVVVVVRVSVIVAVSGGLRAVVEAADRGWRVGIAVGCRTMRSADSWSIGVDRAMTVPPSGRALVYA
jgi:hypothetical protein